MYSMRIQNNWIACLYNKLGQCQGKNQWMQSCCMKHHQGEIVMTIYTIVLFSHASGAIRYFVSMDTWLFVLSALRRAQRVEQVRALTLLVGWSGPLFAISVLLILATGLYMALTAWGLQTGWIDVALISLILIAPLGTAFLEPRRRAIDRLAQEAPDGPMPQSPARSTPDPVPLTALAAGPNLRLG